MATLISAYQLSKSFASKTLFQNISFSIDDGQKIGMIGPNGAGKSTLLSLIAELQSPDSGKISFSNQLKLAYLPQKPTFSPDETIYQALMSVTDDEYDSNHIAYCYQLIAKLQLDQFSEGVEKKVSELSGGWQKKVALARELMKEPNLLLLDEPTNHLDLESILWLEEFLNNEARFSFLMVTHDRRFLQNTCKIIFDLDPKLPQGLLRTNGNYADHIDSKLMLLEGQKRLEDKRRNTMMIEKDWLARGPQARLTKQKARIERAHELIDEVDTISQRNRQNKLNLDFGQTERSPKKLLSADHVSKSYSNQFLFKNFTALVSPGQRYGLIGANGCGKSTLLKCLIGHEKVDSGSIFVNPDIEISYFEQGKDQLNPKITVLKTLCPEGDYVHFQGKPIFARSYLSRFYFKPEQMDMPVEKLSGGEQSRLILARLMLNTAHVLILDEPTNDLDVETLDALTECLQEYTGALILVSHDRFFMDQNCNVIWSFGSADGQIQKFADTEQWEIWFKSLKKDGTRAPTSNDTSTQPISIQRIRLSQKEKFELTKIEQEISEKEKLLSQKQVEILKPEMTSDFKRLNELTSEIADLEKWIEIKFARWNELTLKAEASEKK